MRNENRAVFDRASERYDLAFDLPPIPEPIAETSRIEADPFIQKTIIGRLIAPIARKIRLRRNRLALMELNDDQLKDIGISRSEAYDGDDSRYRMSNAHALERKCL